MSETSSSSGISERREDLPHDNELNSNTAATQGSQTSAPPSSASSTPPVTSEGPDQEGPDQSQEPEDGSEEQSLPDHLESISLNEKPAQDNTAPGTREDALQNNVPNGNMIQGGKSSNTTAMQDSQTSAPPSSTPSKVPDPSPESEEAIEEKSVTDRSACVTPDTPAKDEEGGARAAPTLDCSPIRSTRRSFSPYRARSRQKKSLADHSDNQAEFMAAFIEKWEKKMGKELRPSEGDGKGTLYAFQSQYEDTEKCWKVGFTKSIPRRKKEHQQYYPDIKDFTWEEADYQKLAEKIADHLLRREEGRTMKKEDVTCASPKCKVKHREFYVWKPEVEENLKATFKYLHENASVDDETFALLELMWEEEVKYAMIFAIDEAKKEKYHLKK